MTAPRILVLTSEKGLAETIARGLGSLDSVRPEIDVALTRASACDRLACSRYDLLIVAADDPLAAAGDGLLDFVPPDLPVVAVGGRPGGRSPPPAGLRGRVPFPVSFNLLECAVLESLSPKVAAPW